MARKQSPANSTRYAIPPDMVCCSAVATDSTQSSVALPIEQFIVSMVTCDFASQRGTLCHTTDNNLDAALIKPAITESLSGVASVETGALCESSPVEHVQLAGHQVSQIIELLGDIRNDLQLLANPTASTKNEPHSTSSTISVLDESSCDEDRFVYSVDCRSVNWYGTLFTFTATQAACVKVLIEHYRQNVPEVGESSILESDWVDTSQRRLAAVFNNGKHPAWNRLIIPGSTKGSFRIQVRAKNSQNIQ